MLDRVPEAHVGLRDGRPRPRGAAVGGEGEKAEEKQRKREGDGRGEAEGGLVAGARPTGGGWGTDGWVPLQVSVAARTGPRLAVEPTPSSLALGPRH